MRPSASPYKPPVEHPTRLEEIPKWIAGPNAFTRQATNPKARDFRVDTIGNAFTAETLSMRGDGSYLASAPKPASGYTAWFVEITEPGGGKYPFKFTTEVYVTPDVLPYRWEDAKPITRPAG